MKKWIKKTLLKSGVFFCALPEGLVPFANMPFLSFVAFSYILSPPTKKAETENILYLSLY